MQENLVNRLFGAQICINCTFVPGNTTTTTLVEDRFRNTEMQEYRNTEILKYRNTEIQKYWNTGIQKYRSREKEIQSMLEHPLMESAG